MRPALFTIAIAVTAVAVGVGAYLAVRQNETAAATAVAAANVATATAVAATDVAAAPAVETTEQVVAVTEQVVTPTEPVVTRAPAPEPGARVPQVRPVRPPPAAEAPQRATPEPAASGRATPGRATPGRTNREARPAQAAPEPAPDPPPRAVDAPQPAVDAPPPAADARPTATDAATRPSPPVRRTRARTLPRIQGWELADRERPADTERPADRDEVEARAPDRGTERAALRELVLEADSVIGLQVDSFVTTQTAEVEDDVHARVTRDVLVAGEVAVPAGAVVRGSVTLVEQAGRIKGASRLGVRFHTLVLGDGVEVAVVTETVYREAGTGSEGAARIGSAAIGGAILGAIFGGRRGAAIGGAAGAGGGAVAALATDGEPATLPYGSTLTIRLARPAVLSVPR